jgi:hypothetical protein
VDHPQRNWQEQAREIGAGELVTVIEEIASDIHSIKSNMDRLVRAFPNDDLDGHREWHKIMIERNREMRELKMEIRKKGVIGFLWMILGGIGVAVWHEVGSIVKALAHGS